VKMKSLRSVDLAVAAFFLAVMPLASQVQPVGRPARPSVGDGVASLDVFAQGTTLDLLVTHRQGTDLQLRYRRSTDGGDTWGLARTIDTTAQPISIASRGNDPQVVAHGDHIAVHWSTTGTARFGAGPGVTAISDDAGRSWRSGPSLAQDDTGGAQNFADMTADGDGNFYVAWIGSHDGPAGRALGVARSTDFGASWEHTQLADASSCACCWNRMTTSRAGSVRVLYRDHGIRDMALASTDDAGTTWSLDGTVGAFNWEFPGCPHVGGGIAIAEDENGGDQLHALVWTGHEQRHGLYWLRSDNDGAMWTEPYRMGGERARHADLGAARQNVVAAWDEGHRIWVSVSQNLGNGWSEPRALSREHMVASHPIVVHTGEAFRVFWTERDDAGLLHWRSHRLEVPGGPAHAGARRPRRKQSAGLARAEPQ
jgi:hypothetical protein